MEVVNHSRFQRTQTSFAPALAAADTHTADWPGRSAAAPSLVWHPPATKQSLSEYVQAARKQTNYTAPGCDPLQSSQTRNIEKKRQSSILSS